VLFALGLQVGHVHVAVVVAGLVTTTCMPAICALAGLVPWALEGIRQMLRWPWPRLRVVGLDDQQAGVFALAAGIGLQADAGVARGLAQPGAQLLRPARIALQLVGGANGWTLANSGQVMGIISLVALSFMVQLPSGIMLRSSARSLSDRRGCSAACRFRVVGVEHRVREERAGAAQRGGISGSMPFSKRANGQGLAVFGEHLPQQLHVGAGGGFVQVDAQVVAKVAAQVGARRHRAGSYGFW
jgi:hypothetical protein